MIDPHVHLRDWRQVEKESLAHGMAVAHRIGLRGFFEMPNTSPPLIDEASILQRIADADRVNAKDFFHGIYGGITTDAVQVRDMVKTAQRFFPRVVGLKMYAGHSTGNMGIIEKEAQRMVYRVLAEAQYRGVLALHCEDEGLIKHSRWQTAHAHSKMRPPEAELSSVETQIRFAHEAGFEGSLHICHVSVPESLDIVETARSEVSFSIHVGVTPHHVLLSTAEKEAFSGSLCVNPPLRSETQAASLYEALLQHRIDWIESDHAPHTLKEKKAGMPGLPGFAGYALLLSQLRRSGCTNSELHALSEGNVLKAFRLTSKIPVLSTECETHEPLTRDSIAAVASEYPWDPYHGLY